MASVFIGGSRSLRTLPDTFSRRLDSVAARGHHVVVGDADGADAAIQAHLRAAGHAAVTVFHSGSRPRFNVGGFPTRPVAVRGGLSGYQFHAAKDRAMAEVADFGLMAWDGKSPGSVLNVLRMVGQGKPSVLFTAPCMAFGVIRAAADWQEFLSRSAPELIAGLRARAAPGEWLPFADGTPESQPSGTCGQGAPGNRP
jgi:adenine-specific DNA-methyltransferase